MANNFYPDTRLMFEEVLTGRPLSYTPKQICEEFDHYVKDLQETPIEVSVTYKQAKKRKHGQDETEGEQASQIQTRLETFPRCPRVSDFVCRWLGKDMSWWANIANEERNKNWKMFSSIKVKISTYCRSVKLDGAEVGIFNAQIVSRELGLTDKQQVEQTTKSVQIVVDNAEDAKEMKELIDGTGL